jgi:hypothetical protein
MELRFEPGVSCCATLLLQTGAAGQLDARILANAGKRMTIGCATRVEVGTALKLEWPGHIVMGEIVEIGDDETAVLHVRHAVKTDDIREILQRWT